MNCLFGPSSVETPTGQRKPSRQLQRRYSHGPFASAHSAPKSAPKQSLKPARVSRGASAEVACPPAADERFDPPMHAVLRRASSSPVLTPTRVRFAFPGAEPQSAADSPPATSATHTP